MFAFLYFVVIGVLLFIALRAMRGPCVMGREPARPGTDCAAPRAPLVPVVSLGWALSLFLAISYVVCVGFDLIFPDLAMYPVWIGLMPGMTWLSIPSFLIGLVEAFAYGWYTALLAGGLYNAFAARGRVAPDADAPRP